MKYFNLTLILIVLLFISCDTTEPPVEPVWTVSGPLLFVSDSSGTMQLYSMKLDGTDVKQLTDDPDFPITDAKWSPNGKKIALTSPMGRNGATIFIVNADGTNKYKIANNVVAGVHYGTGEKPNWASDSKSLVFTRLMYPEAIGNMDIYTIDVDGKNEKRITKTISLSEMWASFSCDNAKILSMVIHWNTKDSTGKAIQHFTTNEYDLNGNVLNEFGVVGEGWDTPVWSYDCSQITFTLSDESYNHDIYSLGVDGTNLNRLTNSGYRFFRPVTWADNNKILYNASNSIYLNQIFVMDVSGENKIEITPFNAEFLEATSLKLNY